MMQSGQSAGGWRQFVPTSFLGFERDTEQPPSPALALKFFRGGQAPSGNLLLVGQPSAITKEDGEIEQCLCSQSAQVGCDATAESVQASQLSRHSAWPFSTGLSAFAALGQDGRETRGGLNGEVVDCPWVLIMRPVFGNMTMVRNPWEPDVPDLPKSLQHMLHLPAGTTLYEVYACPSPGAAFESGWLQLIGRIISASKFIPEPASESLHQLRFRHQRKEEDYVLRPEWLQELNGGHSACGSEHFERLLCRRDKTMAAQGGAFTADPLPNARWVWSVGMKAQGGLSSFPRSISTSAAGDMSSRPTSPGSSARTTSRDSLAAALRQRGGRCSPPAAMMPAPEPSPTNRDQSPVAERSGSCCGGCSLALASTTMVLLIAVLGPFFQPSPSEASEGSLKMFTFSILFIAFLFYRTCAKRPGKEEEEEDENWEECFQEAPYLETALRMGHTRPRLMRTGSETWRQDPSREPVLVRGVSAHELLLT